MKYPTLDDQSELIHFEHYRVGLDLGLSLLVSMFILVAILYAFDRRFPSEIEKKSISIPLFLVPFQVTLLGILFLGNLIYSIGISIVFVISLYHAILQIGSGGPEEI